MTRLVIDDRQVETNPYESTAERTARTWDESKHPRDPAGTDTGGQWTSKPGGSDGTDTATEQEDVFDRERVRHFEDRYKDAPIEHALILDGDGKVIDELTGDENHVQIDLDRRSNAVFLTHNHPGGCGGLSFGDVRFAIGNNLDTIRAVAVVPIENPDGSLTWQPTRYTLTNMRAGFNEHWRRLGEGGRPAVPAVFDFSISSLDMNRVEALAPIHGREIALKVAGHEAWTRIAAHAEQAASDPKVKGYHWGRGARLTVEPMKAYP